MSSASCSSTSRTTSSRTSRFGATYSTPLLEWFDYYLQDLDNGVPEGPQAIIQREDGTWSEDEVWPPADTTDTKMKLSKPLGRSVGGLSTDGADDRAGEDGQDRPVDGTPSTTDRRRTRPTAGADRAVFLSKALDDTIRQSGTATVTSRSR